jgi:hypothetical protein
VSNSFEGEEMVRHVPFMHSVGKGAAFDAGVTLLLDPGIKVGLSVTDVGFIEWNGKTRSTLVSGVIRLDSTISIDDLDSLSKLINIEKESEESFRTRSASAVHFGVCLMMDRLIRNFPGKMNVAVELHQGGTESIENPEFPRMAVGIDWKPGRHWPVFLTGLSNSRTGGPSWSLGLGYELNFLEIYLSSPDFSSVLAGEELETLSLSMCWHFLKEKKPAVR